MRNDNRFGLRRIVISLGAVLLWCIGAFTAQQTERKAATIPIRYAEGGISPAALARQEAFFIEDGMADMPASTLWRIVPGKSVSDGGINTSTADVTEIFGQGEDIWTDDMLGGWFPLRDDLDGCVISQGLADALWGNADVVGRALYMNNQEYTVYGVSKVAGSQIMVQTVRDSTDLFKNAVLRFRGGGDRTRATEYLNKAGFTGFHMLDLPLLKYIMSLLAYVPALVLAFAVFIRVLARALRLIKFPAVLSVYILPALAAMGCAAAVIIGSGEVPTRLIPNAWADFEFYGMIVSDMAYNINKWLAQPLAGDMALVWQVVTAVLIIFSAVLFTCVFMTITLNKSLVKTVRTCIITCAGSLASMMLYTFAMSAQGGLRIAAGMWLAPCLWVVTDYGLYLFEQYLIKPGKQKTPEGNGGADIVEDTELHEVREERDKEETEKTEEVVGG